MPTGGSRPRTPEAGNPTSTSANEDSFDAHPEVFVGAAFAGGLVLAGLLRWLGRDE